jgi:ketosteroid isomerase-like protein
VRTRDAAEAFAASWLDGWNSHDLDAVLAHFTEDAIFTSPLVQLISGGENPLEGKAAMRAYWAEGLRRLPDLHFTLEAVHVGDDALAIRYVNERGRTVTEVLILNADGRATQGWALYGPEV